MKASNAKVSLLILVILATTNSGCSLINRIRAKSEINEAARAYKAGHFNEAEQHSRRALELDPEQKNAPTFIARTVHAQYKPGIDTPENTAKARQAIEEYKKILANDPKNEEAYKAIAALYGAIKEDDQQQQWIIQHANDQSVPAESRAEAFYTLASKNWQCSYNITEQPNIKQTVMKDNKALIVYKKPQDQKDYDTARQCVAKGLEEAEKAISLDPKSETAWSYKTNLLREQAKLAEMDGDMNRRAELQKQADQAQAQTAKLSEENQAKKDAEEAKKAQAKKTG
jgi:tetratricopeptide (TPR) repeat protein